jgi:hypothetical protein
MKEDNWDLLRIKQDARRNEIDATRQRSDFDSKPYLAVVNIVCSHDKGSDRLTFQVEN